MTTKNTSIQKSDEGMTKSYNRKRKAVETLMIITFFYVVCSLPVVIDMCINGSNNKVIKNILYPVWMVNSGINATIYLLRTKELRQYYIRAIRSARK